MWLDPLFANDVAQDLVATLLTLGLSLAWLRLMDALAHRGVVSPRLSRKIIHIGTGPLFVLCWNLFSAAPLARWLAALVPAAITVQFALVGLGVIKDPAAVQALTRHNDPREILRGPLYYGLIFVACTVIFWRHSPIGIVALMIMCGGDGLADVVGRRWGRTRLPFSPGKSWIGSAAMFLGGFALACLYIWLFGVLGLFTPAPRWPVTALGIGVIALAATVVEALPLADVDNLTITATAILAGWLWFGV
jgi:phytol kinase